MRIVCSECDRPMSRELFRGDGLGAPVDPVCDACSFRLTLAGRVGGVRCLPWSDARVPGRDVFITMAAYTLLSTRRLVEAMARKVLAEHVAGLAGDPSASVHSSSALPEYLGPGSIKLWSLGDRTIVSLSSDGLRYAVPIPPPPADDPGDLERHTPARPSHVPAPGWA